MIPEFLLTTATTFHNPANKIKHLENNQLYPPKSIAGAGLEPTTFGL